MKSYRVIGEGGLSLWEDMKSKHSLGIVRLSTDDTEIAIGHLLLNSNKEVRVATYGPTRPSNTDTQELGRRPMCQVLSIPKHRVRELVTLS